MPRNNSNLLILSFIASILCCQCNKSKISDEDIVASLLYTLEKDSNLEIKAPYKIIHFENRIDHDQSVVSSHLLFDKKVITKISDQFKSLRRKSTRAGYGKNPSGWEYYLPMSSSEKYQYLIDTFNNQIVLHHQIYFDLQ